MAIVEQAIDRAFEIAPHGHAGEEAPMKIIELSQPMRMRGWPAAMSCAQNRITTCQAINQDPANTAKLRCSGAFQCVANCREEFMISR